MGTPFFSKNTSKYEYLFVFKVLKLTIYLINIGIYLNNKIEGFPIRNKLLYSTSKSNPKTLYL